MLEYLHPAAACLFGFAMGFVLCAAVVMVLLCVSARIDRMRRDPFRQPFGDA